jgi:3-oxoadipate CoA-transferase beta subunit
MLGMGPEANGDEVDLDLINAGKIPVPELPGALYFHQADSCAMKRGGHVDICALRRNQVCKRGDLANWHAGQEGNLAVVGGAMDLAIAAKQRFVMMSPLTREGKSRIAPECTYPLTGVRCVSRIYTDPAVLDRSCVTVRETFGISFAEPTDLVPMQLRPS